MASDEILFLMYESVISFLIFKVMLADAFEGFETRIYITYTSRMGAVLQSLNIKFDLQEWWR